MENCLFVANLPHNLNNYELTIALYLIFSRYGKVCIVKASRDPAHRPFGFVEFADNEVGCVSCREAINENNRIGGIIIGGRKVRLEIARNTSKLIITFPNFIEGTHPDHPHHFIYAQTQLQELLSPNFKSKVIPLPKENAFILKLDSETDPQILIEKISRARPDWSIQYQCDNNMVATNGYANSPYSSGNGNVNVYSGNKLYVAESAQRQSGLFQLLIPDNGVLPVSPSTLAKIHSNSPFLQYSVTPLESTTSLTSSSSSIAAPISSSTSTSSSSSYYVNSPLTFLNTHTFTSSPSSMLRLYEDCHFSSTPSSNNIWEETFTFRDPIEAHAAVSRLNPPLGEWGGDIFFGRLDNQKVTLKCLIERVTLYGKVNFVRLCNRSITREDKVPVDSTAFVRFEDLQAAKNCLEMENGATWLGRIVKCEKCWNFVGKNTATISFVSRKGI